MRLLTLIAASLVVASSACAKEYGTYDAKRVLTVSETPSGKKHGVDVAYLDRMVADLASHARNYPPSFDSAADRRRAEQDARTLSGMLDILVNAPNPNPELTLRAAFVNGIGHNLDLPGAAEKASSLYQRALAASPDDPRGNLLYGTFLAGIGKFRQSIPLLEKATAGGALDATYALGMVYMSLGDKERALAYLERYRAGAPDDTRVSKVIEAVRSGKVEVKASK